MYVAAIMFSSGSVGCAVLRSGAVSAFVVRGYVTLGLAPRVSLD
jgi:hypothetical protein